MVETRGISSDTVIGNVESGGLVRRWLGLSGVSWSRYSKESDSACLVLFLEAFSEGPHGSSFAEHLRHFSPGHVRTSGSHLEASVADL